MVIWGSKVLHDLLLAYLKKLEDSYAIKDQYNWATIEHGLILHNSMGLRGHDRPEKILSKLNITKYQ